MSLQDGFVLSRRSSGTPVATSWFQALTARIAAWRTHARESRELAQLSDRELQVFSLIGRGFGPSQLASELHLSVKTIETHQSHIKEKLGLRSAAELSEKATRWMVQAARRNLQLRKKLARRPSRLRLQA